MSVRLPIAFLMLALAAVPAAADKPADLPQNVHVDCAAQPAAVGCGVGLPIVQIEVIAGEAKGVAQCQVRLAVLEPKCGCTDDCKCCGCKGADEDGAVEGKCACKEGCKCCGCKKELVKAGCPIKGCCSACKKSGSMSWFFIGELFPPLHLCRMCPVLDSKVRQALKPCLDSVFGQCRQLLAASLMATGPAACEECEVAEPVKKSKKHGCHTDKGCPKAAKATAAPICPFTNGKWQAHAKWSWKHVPAEQLTVMPQEVVTAKPQAKVCPYVQSKAAAHVQAPVNEADIMPGTPLENLDKLIKAQRVFLKGERLFLAGEYERADRCFARVMDLCPGSRWDMEAQARRYAMTVIKMMRDAARSEAEEAEPKQEPLPCELAPEPLPCVSAQSDEPPLDAMHQFTRRFQDLVDQARCAAEAGNLTEAQELALQAANLPKPTNCAAVAELLEAAQRSYAAGCHDEAWDLVHDALMLDPGCPAALYLQSKLLQDKGQPVAEPCEESEPMMPDSCPGLGFRHSLPPLDPKIADALAKLVQPVEEQASEEQEHLQIEPEDGDLELQSEVGVLDVSLVAIDLVAMQQAHNEEVLKWIESINSGGNAEPAVGDSEESEEPLFPLETDLDPDW